MTFLTLLRKTLGKELEQDVSEHYQKYMHKGARRYCQSIQPYFAEKAAHHDRALKAVHSVEEGTKTLLADSPRGFLLLEVSSLSGKCTLEPRRATDTLTLPRLEETHGEQARRFTGAVHTDTVHDRFFGSGEKEWCDDDCFGDDDYHSVAEPWSAFGDWQETDEEETTWYDANW